MYILPSQYVKKSTLGIVPNEFVRINIKSQLQLIQWTGECLRGVMVSITGHETSDHWLVCVRGVMVSITGHETSDHWLVCDRTSVVLWLASLVTKPQTTG